VRGFGIAGIAEQCAGRYEAPTARSTTEGSIPLISTKEKDIQNGCLFCCQISLSRLKIYRKNKIM